VILLTAAIITAVLYLRAVFGWRYCQGPRDTNCRICPARGRCGRRSFACVAPYERHDRLCILKDGIEYRAWQILPAVQEFLSERRTVASLAQMREWCVAEDDVVEMAIEMTGEWAVINGTLIRVANFKVRRRKEIGLVLFSIFLWIMLLFLVYARWRMFRC
jgi:hypothetical protein